MQRPFFGIREIIPENRNFFEDMYGIIVLRTGTRPALASSLKIEYQSKYKNCKAALFMTESARTFLLPNNQGHSLSVTTHYFCARITMIWDLLTVSRKAVTQPPSSKGIERSAAL